MRKVEIFTMAMHNDSDKSNLFRLCHTRSFMFKIKDQLNLTNILSSTTYMTTAAKWKRKTHSRRLFTKSKVRPAGQILPSFKFYPARSLVMKYITLVYCYLASSINILHLPTRDQQHFTQHNLQPARIHGQWFSTRILM